MSRPNSKRHLDSAMRRICSSEDEFLKTRTIMANTVVGQILPDGAIKGGSAIKMRLGDAGTRFTSDLDIALASSLEEFTAAFSEALTNGWNGFSGRLVAKNPAKPRNVPDEYVMQPFEVKLNYNNKPWCTVSLEIGHNELGDADLPDWGISEEIVKIFESLGFPAPSPMALMPLKYQVAQKLHGISEPGSARAHDLIDLQLYLNDSVVDLYATRSICERLFAYRRRQAWPPIIVKNNEWEGLYSDQATGLNVLQNVDAAINWANSLIQQIALSGDSDR